MMRRGVLLVLMLVLGGALMFVLGVGADTIRVVGSGITRAMANASYAPIGATFITQTSNSALTGEQALGTLGTGYMKVATGTGVVSSQAAPIPAADGGTGLNSSGSTGVARVNSGTWSTDAGVSHLASSTSAALSGVLSDETGTGVAMFGTSPTITSSFTLAGLASYVFDLTIGSSRFDVYNPAGAAGVGLYQLRTDASNYNRAYLAWNVNNFEIGTAAAGTGSVGTVRVAPAGVLAITADGTASTITNALPTGLTGLRVSVGAKTGDYTVTVSDNIVTGDTTSGNITFTLPAASSAFSSNRGSCFRFKKLAAANTLTVSRAGSDTIDGATTTTLTAIYEAKDVCALSSSTWGVL